MTAKALNVMLVEDDQEDSILIRELLADIATYAIETRWVPTYEEAKAAIAESRFDVCLVDHRLGAVTGLELIGEAQADGFKAPMILLSGSEEYELDIKAMKAGAADFLVKGRMSAASLERSIRHAIERFQSTQDHRIQSDLIGAIIGEGIYALDIEGRVTFMNPASERILGWTEDDLLGKNVHDIVNYETPGGIAVPRERCPLLNVLIKGNTCHLADALFIRRDGTRVALSCTSAPILRDGVIVGAVFNFHDITEQKRAESERRVVTETLLAISTTADLTDLLSAVRDALSKAIYAANFYVAFYDSDGQLAEVPFYADEHDGHDGLTQMMGKGMSEFVFGRSRPTLMTKDVIERLVREGELKMSGAPPAVWVGIPLRSPAGTMGVMVLQHYTDEGAYSERSLDLLAAVGAYLAQSIHGKRIERALSEAAKRESAMIENALDVICTIDDDGRFIDINPACFRLWGYRPDELIGSRFIDYVAPADISRTSTQHNKITGGESTLTFENRYVHKDGSLVDVIWTSYWSEADQLVFAVAHDITERRRMEAELHETRDAALESARLKSEFLANMSHEIRTPMNGVVGMTELLLETELSGQQREFTQTIASSADSLLRIIDEILDFSKIEAGQMRFETIDFDLREAVEVPVEMFAGRAQAKGVEIAALVHSDLTIGLRGDPGRLQQILTNLIGNAVKFTENGEVIIDVTQTSETPTHASVRFEIKDTGIGISDESQQKLFRAFVQADGTTTRKYGGTGLGLAISKKLVELMGGDIELKSKLGEGSVFSFTIRFEKQNVDLESSVLPPSTGLAGARVLIVDDKDTNRHILLHQTTAWGISAEAVASGAEALELLSHSPHAFDFVILDLMMPEMDGFDLARTIKTIPELSHLKLILISSFGKSEHSETAREIGIEEFLQKPVRQSQIQDCLLKVMNGKGGGASATKGIIEALHLNSLAAKADDRPVSNLRILVAEDNEINMEVARNQLRSLGYTADFVNNGQQAVDAAKRHQYDIILMDYQMPEKDGSEATAEIRIFEGEDRHTTIVAVTAHALEGDREKCIAAGMDDYLSKPVKIDALRKMLDAWTAEPTEWPEELSDETGSEVLDRTVLSSYAELQQQGEPDLVIKLIDLFLSRSSASIVSLKNAASEGDMAEIVRQGHDLKGSAGNIGAGAVAELGARIERSNGPANAAELAAILEREYEKVRAILVSIRGQRQKGEI